MILTELSAELFYRAHTPEWASQPLSGAGAAKHGGRLNRPGIHALYLADSAETAIAEYQQLSPLMPPLTLVAYRLSLAKVVDFRGGFVSAQWSPLWRELMCDWRRLAIVEKTEPPSWVLADQVIEAGCSGVLFRSRLGQGVNLVAYVDELAGRDQLEVHDPQQALPRDRSSWT